MQAFDNKYLLCLFAVVFFSNINNGQEIAKLQCERYTTEIEKAEIKSHNRRIIRHVGGIKSEPAEFPFMVALSFDDNGKMHWECGGALISEKFVVTAGHCARHREFGPIKMVRLGTNKIDLPEEQATHHDIPVKRIITHPKYAAPSRYNDIALVELSSQVKYSSTIAPACLNTNNNLENVALTTMGWGRVDFAGERSNDLLKVQLPLVSFEKCKQAYASQSRKQLKNGIDDATQICAGGKGANTCQGDSGTPLQMANGSQHIIVGITSFGKACGVDNSPSVFTRVAAFVPWIESIVWPRV